MVGLVQYAATGGGTDPLAIITTNTSGLLPGLIAIGGAGIAVGAGKLLMERGFGFFKKTSK